MRGKHKIRSLHFPWALRLLLAITLLLALRGWGSAAVALDDAEHYQRLRVAPPLAIYVIAHVGWAILFSAWTFGLYMKKRRAWQGLGLVITIYSVFWIGWFAAFAGSAGERQRLPFLVAITVGALACLFWVLRRPKVRAAFQLS